MPTLDTEIALVDLSNIVHAQYHMSSREPDPDYTSRAAVKKVRELTSQHPHAAICCDNGKSFRNALVASYKENRPERQAALYHQMALTQDALKADGYPVWVAPGFEADDIIATATARALAADPSGVVTVLVFSADKDLVQLVGPRVRVKSTMSGNVMDESAVIERYGVTAAQLHDWLCLVGDTADNVKGAKLIGPKGATDLLTRFGSIFGILTAVESDGAALQFPPAQLANLKEFATRYKTEVDPLITLRTDVPIPFEEIAAERPVPQLGVTSPVTPENTTDELASPAAEVRSDPQALPQTAADDRREPQRTAKLDSAPQGVSVVPARKPVIDVSPSQALEPWERRLEPRNMMEAINLATDLWASRNFQAYGTPGGVLAAIMAGREFGMPTMASLRAFNIIESKPTLAADALRGLVLRSGKAKYFRCTKRTAQVATFETQRDDDPPISLSYTMDEAIASGRAKDGSAYKKDPADVLVARSSSKLARLVYPDVIHGLYAEEEF